MLAFSGAVCAQNHSVLSTGRWWRLTVEQEGIYGITTRDVPSLEGVRVDSIGVYGAGGAMLSTENRLVSTGDLQPLRIEVRDINGNGLFDRDDEVLFFGEGTARWTYDGGLRRWVFEQHAYANANCYFLTTSAPAAVRIATAVAVASDTTMEDFAVVAHVEHDLVNIYRTGQTWLGEKFSTVLPQRTFELRLPGTVTGGVRLRWAVASTGSTNAAFSLRTTGYNQTETVAASSLYRTFLGQPATAQQAYTFTLSYTPSDNTGTGYLDFIELNAESRLTFSSGQTVIRNDRHLGSTAAFVLEGLGEARVWEVSHTGQEREMAIASDRWSDSTTEARRYVAFDDYAYFTPTAIDEVAPQDLHGAEACDFVVVTHPLFRQQAERLAGLHELFDGMATLVVNDEEVYNEYSSGKPDPIALRSLLRDLKERHPQRPPRYMAIFGKANFDNRDLLGSNLPTVAVYETPFSFDDEGASYSCDDILGYLSPTGHGSTSETLEVSVGRMPAKDTAEARHLVDKVERYLTRRDLDDEGARGDWRNIVALLADDADPGRPGDSLFAHSSETIATSLKRDMPQINIDRLYADAYHQQSGAIGSYYPDLNNALRQRMNYGCLLLNYIGHGSTAYIGTERYIELSDVAGYRNGDRMPLFVTSTCSYGRYDLPDEDCGAEACVLASSAMIAVISASRPIHHDERFNRDVVLFAMNPSNTIGDALRMAKNRTATSMAINLIGDPALRLSQPENHVRVTHINAIPVDDSTDMQADVLSRVTVSGVVEDGDGRLLSDFDGTLYPIVYDREVRSSTLANDNPGTEVAFWQQKNVIYKGSHPIEGGRFEYSFVVPKDVAYQYAYAKVSHYAKTSSYEHATGSFSRLKLGGISEEDHDNAPAPEISLFMGDSNFRQGSLTGPSPTLVAHLFDSAGINIGAGLGHDITATLDENPNSLIVLNDLYQQDILDSRGGYVSYTLRDLAPGRHSVRVKAWNIYGISATATVQFVVRSLDTLAFSDLACSPNPATTQTTFTLRVNSPASIASAELQVYNS